MRDGDTRVIAPRRPAPLSADPPPPPRVRALSTRLEPVRISTDDAGAPRALQPSVPGMDRVVAVTATAERATRDDDATPLGVRRLRLVAFIAAGLRLHLILVALAVLRFS